MVTVFNVKEKVTGNRKAVLKYPLLESYAKKLTKAFHQSMLDSYDSVEDRAQAFKSSANYLRGCIAEQSQVRKLPPLTLETTLACWDEQVVKNLAALNTIALDKLTNTSLCESFHASHRGHWRKGSRYVDHTFLFRLYIQVLIFNRVKNIIQRLHELFINKIT